MMPVSAVHLLLTAQYTGEASRRQTAAHRGGDDPDVRYPECGAHQYTDGDIDVSGLNRP
jgi:hypothetical protein